jgi:hypothetical protein
MDDREHENQVESAGEAVEQRKVFAIAPSCRGRGTSDVCDQNRDRFVLLSCGSPQLLKSGGVAVEGYDFGSGVSSQQRIGPRISANIKDVFGSTSREHALDELLLFFNIGRLIVVGGLFVSAPLAVAPLAGCMANLPAEARNTLFEEVCRE